MKSDELKVDEVLGALDKLGECDVPFGADDICGSPAFKKVSMWGGKVMGICPSCYRRYRSLQMFRCRPSDRYSGIME